MWAWEKSSRTRIRGIEGYNKDLQKKEYNHARFPLEEIISRAEESASKKMLLKI